MKKQVLGFEDYSVDTDGRIFSEKFGKVRELKGIDNGGGYLQVELWKNGKSKRMQMHRLVAMAFLDNPENYAEVNHKNGIKTDNRLDNLEWCSRSMNQKHAFAIGLKSNKGSKNNASKITDEQAIEIFSRLDNGEQPIEITKDYPTSRNAITKMKTGRTWTHIPRLTPKKYKSPGD